MADFTKNPSDDSSSSTPSSPSSSTSHGSMAMSMTMTFVVSTTTPLFSAAWTPASLAQYAGTCIFLIALSVVSRFLLAWKSVLEQRWARRAGRRVLIATATTSSSSSSSSSSRLQQPEDEMEKEAEKEAEKEGKGKGTGKSGWGGRPWRFSTDLPRATMTLVISGVGYLLMLAVMTMNVGYFMSVLAGIFVGELVWGRFIGAEDH